MNTPPCFACCCIGFGAQGCARDGTWRAVHVDPPPPPADVEAAAVDDVPYTVVNSIKLRDAGITGYELWLASSLGALDDVLRAAVSANCPRKFRRRSRRIARPGSTTR